MTIKVHADATPEQLETLRSEVETRCPVSDNIGSATPIHISITAAGEEQKAEQKAEQKTEQKTEQKAEREATAA